MGIQVSEDLETDLCQRTLLQTTTKMNLAIEHEDCLSRNDNKKPRDAMSSLHDYDTSRDSEIHATGFMLHQMSAKQGIKTRSKGTYSFMK